jgi:hypothetical protein
MAKRKLKGADVGVSVEGGGAGKPPVLPEKRKTLAQRLREATHDGVDIVDYLLRTMRGVDENGDPDEGCTNRDRQWALGVILERGWGRPTHPGELAPDNRKLLDPMAQAVQLLQPEQLANLRVMAREVVLSIGEESGQTHSPFSEAEVVEVKGEGGSEADADLLRAEGGGTPSSSTPSGVDQGQS